MNTIPNPPGGGSDKVHSDKQDAERPAWRDDRAWTVPTTPDGKTDWGRQREALDRKGLFWEPVRTDDEKVKLFESLTKLEEAQAKKEQVKLEQARLKQGVAIPPPQIDPAAIELEWAMPKHLSSLRMEYLVDPFLPARCVVGFFGRGSTAKSTFLATMAAQISDDWSTLWISVEELKDWITQRHLHAGGAAGTLAVFSHTVVKCDHQGRAVGSSFDIYRELEGSILKAKEGCLSHYNPPRPLRLVVLDTAVGLTTWGKGESPNDDGSVKRLLSYLQALAEQHDVCIAIIGHSNKGKHDYFADTVAGSSAWTNSPRLSFVHASDRREEYAYVMRVAKTNLSSFFAVAYRTEPVLTLHQHQDGPASVLCKVEMERPVWGADASLELFEDATRKQDDEEGGGGHRQTLVERVIEYIVQAVHSGEQPVTRDMVHVQLGREVSRRDWVKVDERLSLAQFQFRVALSKGEQNRVLYAKLT